MVGTGFLALSGEGSRTGMSRVKNFPCYVHCLTESCVMGGCGLLLHLPAQTSTAMGRTRTHVPKMALFPPAVTRSGQTVRSSFAPQCSISFMRRVGCPQMSQVHCTYTVSVWALCTALTMDTGVNSSFHEFTPRYSNFLSVLLTSLQWLLSRSIQQFSFTAKFFMENYGSQGVGWKTLGLGKWDLTVGVLYRRRGSSLVHAMALSGRNSNGNMLGISSDNVGLLQYCIILKYCIIL